MQAGDAKLVHKFHRLALYSIYINLYYCYVAYNIVNLHFLYNIANALIKIPPGKVSVYNGD